MLPPHVRARRVVPDDSEPSRLPAGCGICKRARSLRLRIGSQRERARTRLFPPEKSRMARVWSTLVALVLLLSGTRLARAAELELPTAAMQRYYATERRTGAERSEALARALLALAAQAPPAARQELLQKAARTDPTLPEPHLAYARLQLQRHDLAGACLALRDAAQCVVDDAFQQAAWLRRLERLGHTLPLVTLATLLVLFTARSAGFVHHLVEVRQRTVAVALLTAAAVMALA